MSFFVLLAGQTVKRSIVLEQAVKSIKFIGLGDYSWHSRVLDVRNKLIARDKGVKKRVCIMRKCQRADKVSKEFSYGFRRHDIIIGRWLKICIQVLLLWRNWWLIPEMKKLLFGSERTWTTIPGRRSGAWRTGAWPGSSTGARRGRSGAGWAAAAIRGHPPGGKGRTTAPGWLPRQWRMWTASGWQRHVLVMPAGEGRREGEGREWLRWWSVWEGEVWWRCGPGPRLLTSGERERCRATALVSRPFGRRWEAVGRRRKAVRSSAWLPISTKQRPITWRAPGPGASLRSLWTGLTRNPWWYSVTRGARRPQRVRAHNPRRNSRTHRRLGWSNTQKIHHLIFHGRKQSILHVFHPILDVRQRLRCHWGNLGGRDNDLAGRDSDLIWWMSGSTRRGCWHLGGGHWRSNQEFRKRGQGRRSRSRSCRVQGKGAWHPRKKQAKRSGVGKGAFGGRSWRWHNRARFRRGSHSIREGPGGSSMDGRYARNIQRQRVRGDDGTRSRPRPGGA